MAKLDEVCDCGKDVLFFVGRPVLDLWSKFERQIMVFSINGMFFLLLDMCISDI